MRQTTAQCAQLELIGNQVRLHFQTDLRPAPGQILLARLAPGAAPYLPQPLQPTSISETGFTVDLPASHPHLRFFSPGNTLEVIGPIGAALPELPPRARILLVADSTPAALLPLATRAIAGGGTATLLLAAPYPLEALDPEIELRLGDLPALLAEYVSAADCVFIHTAPQRHSAFYQTIAQTRALVATNFARALIQLPLPCGVGACGACYLKTARGWKLTCIDGPFFSLADLQT